MKNKAILSLALVLLLSTAFSFALEEELPLWDRLVTPSQGPVFEPHHLTSRDQGLWFYSWKNHALKKHHWLYGFDADGGQIGESFWTESPEEGFTESYLPMEGGRSLKERILYDTRGNQHTASDRRYELVDEQGQVLFTLDMKEDLGVHAVGSAFGSTFHNNLPLDGGILLVGGAARDRLPELAEASETRVWVVRVDEEGQVLYDQTYPSNQSAFITHALGTSSDRQFLVGRSGDQILLMVIDGQGHLLAKKEISDLGKLLSNLYGSQSDSALTLTPKGDLLLLTQTLEDASYQSGHMTYQRSHIQYHISRFNQALERTQMTSFYGIHHRAYEDYPYEIQLTGITALGDEKVAAYGRYKPRDRWMLSRFDPLEKYKAYLRLMEPSGTITKEVLYSPSKETNHLFVHMVPTEEGLAFLGRQYDKSMATGQTWIGAVALGGESPQEPVIQGASSWALPLIQRAQAEGLAPDFLYDAYQQTITREEFCSLSVTLYEALSGQSPVPAPSSVFSDTKNPHVLKAYQLRIVQGTGQGQFSPLAPVTREQIATMFFNTLRAVDDQWVATEYSASFTDDDAIASWAKRPVGLMAHHGILGGVGGNRMAPREGATREQAIALVVRTFDVFKK